MLKKELSQLDENCVQGLTRSDDQNRKELKVMVMPPELVPFAIYLSNKLIPFHNFHPSERALFDGFTAICNQNINLKQNVCFHMNC
jgi:hypothetical protein